MQCKSCGATAQGKYDFCPKCGAYIKHQSEHRLPIPHFHRPQAGRKDAPQKEPAKPPAPPAPAAPSDDVKAASGGPIAGNGNARTASSSSIRALAVRPGTRAVGRTLRQTVRVRRKDPFPTYAGITIFMALWLLAMLFGFGAAGVYQGLQDRQRMTLESAQQHKDQAKAYIKEGNIELAIEELRYARQLNPKDKEIVDLLVSLQPQPSTNAPNQPLPTPTLSRVSQEEILGAAFAEAKKSYDQKDYDGSAAMLEGLRRVEPGFRKTEVEEMLFTGYLNLARQYLKEERWEEAVQKFDRALAVRKDEHVQLERYLASIYVRGLSAWAADWKRAVESFAEIVKINPEYLDSYPRLYQSRIEYGDYLMARNASCLAIEHYTAALTMVSTVTVQNKQVEAVSACTASGGSASVGTPAPGSTRAPAPTPTPTVVGGGKYRVQVSPNMQATTDDTASIRGQVLDKAGKPVAHLELQVASTTKNYQRVETTDEFGFFSFDGLDPDSYLIRARSDPASASQPLFIGRKQRAIINFFQN